MGYESLAMSAVRRIAAFAVLALGALGCAGRPSLAFGSHDAGFDNDSAPPDDASIAASCGPYPKGSMWACGCNTCFCDNPPDISTTLIFCTDASSPGSDSGAGDIDAGSGLDSAVSNDAGAECITGCSRGAYPCTAPDPPNAWSCSGPGIGSADRFLEAGCTSAPINSVAWCCPAVFMSQCVCTPGQDWTCNDNPTISSIHGTCLPDHSCSCSMGSVWNPATGRCK